MTLLSRRLLLVSATAFSLAPAAWAASGKAAAQGASGALAFDTFNADDASPTLAQGARSAAVARAQILLDRAWFSPGEIDGAFGKNMQRMVRAFQRCNGLKDSGRIDAETWRALRQASTEPLLARYTVTEKDAAGPFAKTPADMAERAKLKALPYESLVEMLGERFHVNPDFLKRLNPGVEIAAATELVVPNVRDSKAPERLSQQLEIDKSERVLFVLDKDGQAVAGFPISIGNEDNDPLPLGGMAIKNVAESPSFTYNPSLLKNSPKDAEKAEIPPGPNNPVGSIWLGLTKPHWGIHGTPDPATVGHSETNGCIHLTNWDAERLAKVIKAGAKVEVKA
ncbi:Lipoprotein-anchoring transpeptidase ErfK/SrfK [Oryzisolibacter propanilivorax]|uniref:Lipoprotein-anchoring transpeptidase ErfK/SrfK n=1 Tax=Oryzisolibacter propanilivorax TaxID=1527607 RepID=A0A1G9QG04_9BURK|nr:L,D-transpeptidase [Oryzisolibacter propanilivorax]SDM09906.1 Lipoprotein-anchoring transpeptidase ErfK/SrfK [Oryzisolibacter propanilivorax]